MIRLIQGSERDRFPREIIAMHRLRAEVFRGRQGWPVQVIDGLERDRFDELNPLYILVLSDVGEVCGAARLLPTTGPHMLAETFAELLPAGQVIRSPIIWESSRFAVQPSEADRYGSNQVSRVTGELLSGIIEVGICSGLEFIVTVMDVAVERVLRRAGCPCDRLAPPRKIGDSLSIAALFEMGEELLASVRAASGLEGSTLCAADARRIGLVS